MWEEGRRLYAPLTNRFPYLKQAHELPASDCVSWLPSSLDQHMWSSSGPIKHERKYDAHSFERKLGSGHIPGPCSTAVLNQWVVIPLGFKQLFHRGHIDHQKTQLFSL